MDNPCAPKGGGEVPMPAMARSGYGTTAVCATYGGPLLTLCVGLGSAFCCQAALHYPPKGQGTTTGSLRGDYQPVSYFGHLREFFANVCVDFILSKFYPLHPF